MFYGSMVALVTPLKNDHVDVTRLEDLVKMHVKAGTQALVVVGTTGEGGTLSLDEQDLVIKTVVRIARGHVPVIAGAYANSTALCIKYAANAMNCGADAILVMTPAYIKPTQAGLYEHYARIAQSVHLPIILYNVPSRTACDLLPETVARLALFSNIIGIKDATGDMQRLNDLLKLTNNTIDVYSGDDPTAVDWMLAGAKGVISVTANVAPKSILEMCDAALSGNNKLARLYNSNLMPLHELMFVETNPIPVKWALHHMGLIENEIRLPLTRLSASYQVVMDNYLKHHINTVF